MNANSLLLQFGSLSGFKVNNQFCYVECVGKDCWIEGSIVFSGIPNTAVWPTQ